MPFESPARRHGTRALLLLAAAAASACIFPHFRHLEHVDDVQRVLEGQTTREEVRDRLGAPGMVDTPGLYVYDWEKAKALAGGYSYMAAMGHTGTRALFVFDDDGRVARAEIQGTGQGEKEETGGAAKALPRAATAPLPSGECGEKRTARAWFAGPEPRLVLHHADGIRVCDARGSRVVGDLQGKFYGFALSPDGRLAATYDHEKSLTLRSGSTLERLRELEPPSTVGLSLVRWGLGISFSSDSGRVAAYLTNHGITVYDTATGEAVLRLPDRWSPRLSPDGTLLVSKAKTGFFLTEVDTGRDVAVRPPPKYPYGIAQDPYLARSLSVSLGSTAFSPDGKRLAVASCAHAEVWDLGTMLSSGWKRGLQEAFLLPFSSVFGVCAAAVMFSSDGASLAIANEGSVTLYDLLKHEVRGSYAIPALTIDASFTPDLTTAAFVTRAGLLTWEVGKVSPPAPEGGPTAPPAGS
jgi:hypothetical protein